MNDCVTRRRFIRFAMLGLAGLAGLASAGAGRPAPAGLIRQTRLDKALDIDIPEGSSLRVIARSGRPVLPGSAFLWHSAPDGGGLFPGRRRRLGLCIQQRNAKRARRGQRDTF